jgi:RNA polymerase sigma-70 factor, ECF subfamily
MDPSDHELMRRVGAGDPVALESIVARWDSRVWAVLRRLVIDPGEAEDLRQETFVRLLRAASRYHANGAFSTWLYRIVVNLARDASRRRQRRPAEPLGDHQPLERGEGPVENSVRHELARHVDAAVAALAPELREVLVVKHYGQLSFAAAAAVLGEPASTLKSRMLLAFRQLREELRRQGVTEGELDP